MACNKETTIEDAELRPIFELGKIDGKCSVVGADIGMIATDIMTIRKSLILNSATIQGTPTFENGFNLLNLYPIYVRSFNFVTMSTAAIPAFIFRTQVGKAYRIEVRSALASTPANNGGEISLFTRAKNVAGVLTISSPGGVSRILDSGFTTANITFTSSAGNIIINLSGIAATRVNWNVYLEIIEVGV